jgi:hypothetical protein
MDYILRFSPIFLYFSKKWRFFFKKNPHKVYKEVLRKENELLMEQKDLQREIHEANSIITDGSKCLLTCI